MKTKSNVLKKLMLFAAAFAFCAVLCAKPMDVKAAMTVSQDRAYTSSSSCYIELSWDDVASYYSIETSLNKVNWTMQEDEWYLNYITIYDLLPGQTYYVRITPNVGSPVVVAATTAPRSTSAVTQVATSTTSTQIAASWPATAGATGYAIYYGVSSYIEDAAYFGQTAATSVTFTGLPSNSAFYVFVIPHRNGWLSNLYYKTSVVTAPTAPKKLSVKSGSYKSKYLTFYWEPTSVYDNTDGYEVQAYYLTTKGKEKKIGKVVTKTGYGYKKDSTGTSVCSYVDVKSSKLFKYPVKFQVRAYKTLANGTKVYSPYVKLSKPYIPQAPQKSLKVYRYSKTGTLKWNKVSGASSYTIYYKTSANGKWKVIKKNVKGTSATVKASYYGYNYYYVKANKVKVGKKKYSSAAPKKAPYVQYWY